MANKSFDNVSWLLDAVVSTFCMSIVDDSVKANADFQYNAGMSPKIIRTTDGKCCEWCNKLAGVYDYEKVKNTGNEVFRRHRNCGCVVAYDPGDGRIQNAHTKEWTTREEYDRLLQEKEHLLPQQREAIARMKQEGGKLRIPSDVEGDFSDFSDLTISEKEREAFIQIRKRTLETGFEEGCVKQQNGNFRIVKGTEKGGIEIEIIEEDGFDVGLFHTHTNDTPFSSNDFKRFIDEKVECIGVVTDNEDVFVCKIGAGWRPESEEEYKRIAKVLFEQANANVKADPRFRDWSYEERIYMAVREQAFLTARYFEWELQGGKL